MQWLMVVAILGVVAVAKAEESPDDLLDSIAIARNATVDQIPAGHGLAIVTAFRQGWEKNALNQGVDLLPVVSQPAHRVSFVFLKERSLAKWYPGDKGDLANPISTAVVRDGRFIRYVADSNQLFINNFDPMHSVFLREPFQWTYSSIVRIPGVIADDDTVFFRSSKKRGVISRRGNCITITRNEHLDNVTQYREVTFDMTLGGMITSYKTAYEEKPSTSTKGLRRTVEIKNQWSRQGDFVVPINLHQHMVLSQWDDPSKVSETGDLDVKF